MVESAKTREMTSNKTQGQPKASQNWRRPVHVEEKMKKGRKRPGARPIISSGDKVLKYTHKWVKYNFNYNEKNVTTADYTSTDNLNKTKWELRQALQAKVRAEHKKIAERPVQEKARKMELEDATKSMGKIKEVVFLNLKDTLDNSIVANNYLFELVKKSIQKNKKYHGLYKITIVKKDDRGIACTIVGGNYTNNFFISNENIMEKKSKTSRKSKTVQEDKLEDITRIYYTKEGEKREETIPGKKEDYLMELERGDSLIIDVQDGKVRKIHPDNMVEEIGKYIKKNDSDYIKAKKIQTAMKFLNESRDSLGSEYIQDFFKIIKNKYIKRNKGKQGERPTPEFKKLFGEILKKYLNETNIYLHKDNDIDKSAIKFLLKKFGVRQEKLFREIDHDEGESIHEWTFFDVLSTVNGIKTIKKITGKDEKWRNIIKTKTIVSEHKDKSNEAMLSNRPGSTTRMVFRIAKELWVIDEKELPQIQNFVNFVNTVDSMDYQISAIDYKNNYHTLFGLYRTMDIEDIFNYFKNPDHTWFEKMPESYMKNIKTINYYGEKGDKTLQDIGEKHKQRIEKNIMNFEKIKQLGHKMTLKGQKFIVDIQDKVDNQIQDGPQTAGYNGYGFFTIGEERGNIYMYSPKKLPATIQWFSTDGHFLIINNATQEHIEKLFEEKGFTSENSTLKSKIIQRLRDVKAKNTDPLTSQDITTRCKMLPMLEKKDLAVGQIYKGVINNHIQNKIAYVTLNQQETVKGIIKVEDRNQLKQYKKGDIINIKVENIPGEEGKLLTLSLVKE